MRILAFFLIYATVSAQNDNNIQQEVREYYCPKNFIRAGNTCYYMSTTKTTWKKAFFECAKIKNSTLATPDTHIKDKFLRRHLRRRTPDKRYRWIGGMYNWKMDKWVWGTTGKDFKYKAFANQKKITPSWTCSAMDPANHFKWAKRSCVSEFYFICEKPMRKRRKNKKRRNGKNDRNQNEVALTFDPKRLFWIKNEPIQRPIVLRHY